MNLERSIIREKLAAIHAQFLRWLFRRNLSDLNETLSPEAKILLLKKAEEECLNNDGRHESGELQSAYFSPRAMLAHPFLIPFIRPASRMARKLGYNINNIPIISSPNLIFAGRAITLDDKITKIAMIPLGSIMLLRELGLAIVNLHNAIEKDDKTKIAYFARVCRFMSGLIYKPAATAYGAGQVAFDKVPFSHKLFAVQTTHVLGIFLILHELGHICKNHNLDPLNDEQCRNQELEADVFAMDCQFSPRKGNPKYEPFRRLQMIYVCNMFTIFDIGLTDAGVDLDGYPSFADRREALLKHYSSDYNVVLSTIKFRAAIAATPPPDFSLIEELSSRAQELSRLYSEHTASSRN